MPTPDEIALLKRKRRRAGLIGLTLFTPWTGLMSTQVALAAQPIEDLFDATDDLIDDGYSVKQALFILNRTTDPAANAIEKAVHASLMQGYKHGYAFTGQQVRQSSYADTASRIAQARGSEVSALMNTWTRKALKKNIDNKYVVSGDRATRAVKYEMATHFYEGLLSAASQSNVPHEKTWLTTSDNPCEECIENEDAGWIPLSSEFPSGDYGPLAHLNCGCILSLQPAR